MLNFLPIILSTLLVILTFASPSYGDVKTPAGDWPYFNRDRYNSCFSPLTGKIKLDNPKAKWQREHPFIDTGFTCLSQQKLLDFTPALEDRVVFLNPDNGKEKSSLDAPALINPTEQGASLGVPLFEDVTGDWEPELIATIDSYGVVVWKLGRGEDRWEILWSKAMPLQSGGGTFNVVVGDVNNDGKKELIVTNDHVALRELYCLNARTGEELWVFTDRDLTCTINERECRDGRDTDWLQGTIGQNFPVWTAGKLYFQHQFNFEGKRGVEIISIETFPSIKSMTIYNNPPGAYSQAPVLPVSYIASGGNPAIGEYRLEFPSASLVTVNGGQPLPITADSTTPHTNVITGLVLYFNSSTQSGDRAIIQVHNAPRRVWKKSFLTGYCFAHFLLADFNEDGREEIAFGTTERYYLIDRDGNVLWQYDTGIPAQNVPYASAVFGGAFADIDGDGIKEILFNAFDTLVCLKGHNGTPKWTFQVPFGDLVKWGAKQPTNVIRAFPLIADLNGDGGLEVVMADAEHVYAIDKDGHVAMKYRFATFTPGIGSTTPDGKLLASPFTAKRVIFADTDRDGKGELICSLILADTPKTSMVFSIQDQEGPQQRTKSRIKSGGLHGSLPFLPGQDSSPTR